MVDEYLLNEYREAKDAIVLAESELAKSVNKMLDYKKSVDNLVANGLSELNAHAKVAENYVFHYPQLKNVSIPKLLMTNTEKANDAVNDAKAVVSGMQTIKSVVSFKDPNSYGLYGESIVNMVNPVYAEIIQQEDPEILITLAASTQYMMNGIKIEHEKGLMKSKLRGVEYWFWMGIMIIGWPTLIIYLISNMSPY